MPFINPKSNARIAALVLAGMTCAASADIAEVATDDGKTMTFEYEGDKLRINIPDQAGYMILRDEHLYMITDNNGQMMVVDMNSAFSMFGGMAKGTTPDMMRGEVVSLDSTGKSETVAGIRGEVYTLKFTDHEGKLQQEELVLSEDSRAIGFRDAIGHMASTMATAMKKSGLKEEAEAGEEIQRVLESHGKGVLRYGNDMRVSSISSTTVAEERFFLPAAPTDLGAMMGGMMGNSGGQSGGGFGDVVSDKAERQQDRVEQKTDNAVDRATDNAVDKVLDKAFGKIFGN